LSIKPGDTVTILGLEDNWEEHQFLVLSVKEDLITGFATTGPFQGEYGEPSLEFVKEAKNG
jgi:hypothetical protein